MLELITPLVLTYNEEPNIGRLLDSLRWARRVVVVDSGSRDATRAVVDAHPNAVFVEHAFETHASQWNFGLRQMGIDTEWVLALDADYGLTPDFLRELESLRPAPDVAGYAARFVYCIQGRVLRGGLYPPVIVLFRRGGSFYAQEGHTQRLRTQGRIDELRTPLLHDDRKPVTHWLWSQARYARLEAEKIAATPFASLRAADKLRRFFVIAPLAAPLYSLILKAGVLDGTAGIRYAMQRAVAEAMIAIQLARTLLRKIVQ